jgi:hypothetical protein
MHPLTLRDWPSTGAKVVGILSSFDLVAYLALEGEGEAGA